MSDKQVKGQKINLRDKQATETKEKLMKAAVQLFFEQGYTKTSVRAINRQAGVADGLLYHYFSGGKSELFHDVVEVHVKKVIDEVSNAGIRAEYEKMPLEKALEMHLSTVFASIEKHINVFTMVCRDSAVRDLISKEELDILLNSATFQFSGVIQKKIDAGELRNIDISAAGRSLCSMIMSYVFYRVMDVPNPPLGNEEMKKQMIRYYVDCWKK